MLNSLPNLLTILRIVCIPVLMALFYVQAPWAPWAACGVFVAAAITDYFDGWLARRLQQVSAFGRLLDPIADKMLVAATLLLVIGFGRLGTISLIPAVVILLREFLISGLREFLAGREVGGGLAVSGLAKWKTTVQMVALALLIVGDAAPEQGGEDGRGEDVRGGGGEADAENLARFLPMGVGDRTAHLGDDAEDLTIEAFAKAFKSVEFSEISNSPKG